MKSIREKKANLRKSHCNVSRETFLYARKIIYVRVCAFHLLLKKDRYVSRET